MFPFVFEWQWNADHGIFLGLLYLALIIIAGGLTYALAKTWIEFPKSEDHAETPKTISSRTKYSEF